MTDNDEFDRDFDIDPDDSELEGLADELETLHRLLDEAAQGTDLSSTPPDARRPGKGLTPMSDLHKLADVDCRDDPILDNSDVDDLLIDLADMDSRLEKLKADANGYVSIDDDTLFCVTELLKRSIFELEQLDMNVRSLSGRPWRPSVLDRGRWPFLEAKEIHRG